jgi:serine/threonine protein kinase
LPILTTAERIGTVLAQKYRLTRVLGEGGMGVVFEGRHEFTRRRVAVKLLHPHLSQNEAIVQRFLREARAAAALKHKNVVDVLDMGTEADGAVYLVLEFLAGEAFSARLEREQKLSPEACAELLLPIMNALRVAHSRGIIHRDIKPENVFLCREEESGELVPKLLDFGIAKLDDGGMRATSTGQAIGTPAYMAPEQATNASEADARADVWSLGVMWFEALSGRLPYDADSPMQMLGHLLSRDPLKLSDIAADVPLQLARVVERALQRDREKRWATVEQFIEALRQCFPEGALAPAVESTGQFRAITRSETLIEPAAPRESAPSDATRDERAMMATLDAGSDRSADGPREQPTLDARPARSARQEPASPPARVHETLAGVEQPRRRARPAWLVGASALGLAAVVGLVAVGSARRAPAAQPQRTPGAPSSTALSNARAATVGTEAPHVDPPSLVSDSGVAAAVLPVNTAPTTAVTSRPRVQSNAGSTRVTTTRPERGTSGASAPAGSNTTSAGSATSAQGSRVRVMGW